MKSVLSQAVVLATLAHQNQYRKNTLNGVKIPYIIHCNRVLEVLLDLEISDEDVLAAAMCHDTLEDVKEITYDVLRVKLNEKVANLVQELTHDSKKETKEEYLLSFQNKSIEACIIKAADRICNCCDFYFCEETKNYSRKYFHKADKFFEILFSRWQELQSCCNADVLKHNYENLIYLLDGKKIPLWFTDM